jgi:FtsZ-binding cell division protein ZapB
MAEVDAEISKLKLEQDELKKKIALSDPKSGSAQQERSALRTELNALKDAQAANKSTRGATLDELKRLQNKVADKVSVVHS